VGEGVRRRWRGERGEEVEGPGERLQAQSDAGRTEVIERMGVSVIRFTNEEVNDDLDAVLARIHAALRAPLA